MELLEDVVLNLILMMFPVLVYFIYNCYREVCMEKYNHLLLDVSLVTSMYLCFKYGTTSNPILGLLFCNLPIVVAYLKKQSNVGVLLSLIVIVYCYFHMDIRIEIIIIQFVSYFVLYLVGQFRKIKDNVFILLIAIMEGFFFTLEYFYVFKSSNLFSVLEIFLFMLLFYGLPYILLYLFRLAEQITSLYLTVSELEKDKQLKNSLFKITHEVKNPIAVCKGYLDMLEVDNKEQIERYVPIIKQEIARSLDIMSDFMEFSKIKIDKDIIDINLLLEDIEEELSLLMVGKDIQFQLKLVNDEVYIMGDYNRLKQVFVNLVKNSLEAMDVTGKIMITGHILKDCYYIEVEDNGCGMDQETLVHVKEMFYTTKVKGSGLGVSLSNEIIKAHDGSIDYFSKVGKGTKVVVKLPVVVL